MILAGDIGGTKCNLALFPAGPGRAVAAASATIASGGHPSFESVLESFRRDHPAPVAAAAFGVAGPVVDGVCKTTNLPWTIREASLAERLGTPRVRLLNDLAATAIGIEWLRDDEVETLQPGAPGARGNRAVIAAGTGLGEAALVADGGRRIPVPSEGGHADFAPRDEVELGLWRWLREANPRVEYEMVLSGPGIVNLYRFYHRSEPHPPLWQPGQEKDPESAAAVSRAALAGDCPGCRETLERFAAILGAEAGNLALKVMATGGVYVAGGIAPKVLPLLRERHLLDAFRAKGAFTDLMRSIPVRVVLNAETALLGAARAAGEL